MIVIFHKFRDYKNQKDIEVLFLGTFNPETTCNRSTFFYGRPRNFFWQLMPIAFGKQSLVNSTVEARKSFLAENKIGIIDIIASLTVDQEEKLWDYDDAELDKSAPQWNEDVFKLIDACQNLKTIFFTRKTFQGIPNIGKRFSEIKKYAEQKNIKVEPLVTPSRFTNEAKQNSWIKSISLHKSREK
jgi:G:T/U-mismatch repair DNA glycosylase